MHARRRPLVVPLLLVASLAVAGCGGGDDDGDDRDAVRDLPAVKQDQVLDAPDVAAANALCAKYQQQKPKLVTQLRFRVKGSPSVPCIVQ